MSWTNISMLEEWPGQEQGQLRLRNGASDGVRRLLRWAAVISFFRSAVLPWLIVFAGYKRAIPIIHEPMLVSSIGCGLAFLLCGSMARLWSIRSVLLAMLVFGYWTYYDFNRTSDLIEAGTIGKSVIGLLLVYAFMQGVMSRTL